MSTAENDSNTHGRITVENTNVPGRTSAVNAAKYWAMLKALMQVLPTKAPGLTLAEMYAAVLSHLPDDLFPGSATAGWWVKAEQLDREARGTVVREDTGPLRWHRRLPG